MSRDEAFAALSVRGATRAVVQFSGGNDEGGPDLVRLFAGQRVLGELTCARANHPTPGEIADEELADGLSEPIYDQYGSFAGDYEVNGEVIWDLSDRTVLMVKAERAEWEHIEEHL